MVELRDDSHPKNWGYWPGTPSQWREPTVDDCTWYAGEAAWESASNSHLSMHPVRDLRNKSNDTQGGTAPLNMMQEMTRLWPASEQVRWRYGTWNKEELVRALFGGASLLIGGDYEKLPPHYRRWTNNDVFNHEMMVKFIHDPQPEIYRVFLYDPLGGGPTREPYDGEWIPFDELFGPDKFTWRGTGGWYAGIVQNAEFDAVRKVFAEATREVRVKRGAPVFRLPRALEHDKKLWNADQWRDFYGRSANGWFLISYWKNNEKQYGYVQGIDVLEQRPKAVPPVTDVNALKLANTSLQNIIKGQEDRIEDAAELLGQARTVLLGADA